MIKCVEVKGDRGRIPGAMVPHWAAWWALGNEPNDPNTGNLTPEEYAELYHIYEGWAGRVPRCGILPVGIADADWEW